MKLYLEHKGDLGVKYIVVENLPRKSSHEDPKIEPLIPKVDLLYDLVDLTDIIPRKNSKSLNGIGY